MHQTNIDVSPRQTLNQTYPFTEKDFAYRMRLKILQKAESIKQSLGKKG
ncbi:hypothetical protein CCP2SC5_660020 [Azospirillaceae bacterium]